MRKSSLFVLAVATVAFLAIPVASACGGPLSRLRAKWQARHSEPAAAPAQTILPTASPVPMPKAVKEPQSFESALREQIALHPDHHHAKRVAEVLNMPEGERRTRILDRLERHAAAHIGITGEVGKIDWSAIDWAKFFDTLMKILAAILPFLLAASNLGDWTDFFAVNLDDFAKVIQVLLAM